MEGSPSFGSDSSGLSGEETITLLDGSVNKDYVYLIGVEDYGFINGGATFLSSGAQIRVSNGEDTVSVRMEASSISPGSEY